MSSPESSPSPSALVLTNQELSLRDKIVGNPVDWPKETKSYLEEFVRTMLPTTKFMEAMVARIAWPVGQFRIVPEDLTANTGEYVWTDTLTNLTYLYCNGAAVSQADYADLYGVWGASKWGADSGGNFLLPDSRGRGLVLCGTNAAVDLGDTFGPATESARTGYTHGHATTALTVTGAPDAGTLATSGGPYVATPGLVASSAGSGAYAGNTTNSPTITGAPGLGTLDVGGTIGTDTNEGGSGIVIGSLVVRF